MLKIQSLLQNFYKTIKSVSKKNYANCFIITAGAVVVAVISLSSNAFDGAGKNKVQAKQLHHGGTVKAQEEVDLEAKLQEAQEVFNTDELLMGEVVSETDDEILVLEDEVEEIAIESNQPTIVTQSNHIEDNQEFNIELSQVDLEALLRIVEAEATGEDLKGKILVANVVLNRVNSDNFPDTVKEVVFEKVAGKVQFSPVADGRYYSVNVSEQTRDAVEQALEGVDYSQGALFFVARSYASAKNLNWFDRNLTKLFSHGVHEFFTY